MRERLRAVYDRLRVAYGQMRRVPGVGPAVSRLVWAAKGALGRPVRWPRAAAGAACSPGVIPIGDRPTDAAEARLRTELSLAMAAIEGLAARLAPPPAPIPPSALIPAAAPIPAPRSRPASPRRPRARAPHASPLDVSVVVNTYDRAPYLRRLLAALGQLRYGSFEVIVVDGPSSDDTADVLAQHAGVIRLARCPEANLARSRNIGLAMARGEIVAFIDDDAVPEPDWLDELAAAYADPQIAAVGGFIRDRSGVGFQCKVVVADRFGGNEVFDSLADAAPPSPAVGAARYLTLTGANASFRRLALAAIGGFDEAYSYFLEETDVCLRLVDAGLTIAVAPGAEAHHAFAASHLRHADRTPRSLLATVRSTAYFATRNAAPIYGLAAATRELAAYAEAVQGAIGGRRAEGLIDADHAGRLTREVQDGLAEGVRIALASPVRQLLSPASSQKAQPAGGFLRHRPRREAADRLRLCLLSQQYGEADDMRPVGGIAVHTRALAQGLAAAGHEVTVLARGDGASTTVRYEPAGAARGEAPGFEGPNVGGLNVGGASFGGPGVWVHRVAPHARAVAHEPAWLRALPPAIAGHSRALRDEAERVAPRRHFDLALGPIWDLEPAALLAQGRLATVVSLHTAYALALASKPDWTADAAYRAAHVDPVITGERALLARAPWLMANSAAVVTDMAQAYGLPELAERAFVIPHGLPDLARGRRPPSPAPDRNDAAVEVLFVGRLEPRKGVDVLLQAAAEVLAAEPGVRFVLAGEDVADAAGRTLRETFRRRFAGAPWLRDACGRERIVFTGPLSTPDLLDRYAACDLFVAPSRYESFGLVFLEAMIFARPAIGCAVGGIGEVVADGETGLLVAPGDAGALARAILELVRAPERRLAMGRAGRKRYEARFTADAMVQASEQLFEAVKRDAAAALRPAAE